MSRINGWRTYKRTMISFIEFFIVPKLSIYRILVGPLIAQKAWENTAQIRYAWTLTLPIAMLAMYISIFCSIRRKRQSILDQSRTNSNVKKSILFVTRYKANNGMRTDRREQLMLVQAVLICGAVEIEIICFNFLSKFAVKLFGEKLEIPINIFINCYVILNASMMPTVNLIFVKRFRDEIKNVAIKLLSKILNTMRTSTVIPTISIALTKIHPISRAKVDNQ
ncbi:hypothetical protein DINM_007232 [Dirofilaria immitis]|nr:hypothetical protein [Dirofilaria immitis]